MAKGYQKNYASNRPQMYDTKSRTTKALRIVKTLQKHLVGKRLGALSVLDAGASTGIIDNYLSDYFEKVVGIDIDGQAIRFAQKNFSKKNLEFKIGSALKIPYPNGSYDVVICTHIYEHVPNPKKLFDEIYRALKPGGICYLAAVNKFWPIEPHYNLPFLSYLPRKTANFYIKIVGQDEYYEHLLSYWQLKNLLQMFKINDLTTKILSEPQSYGYDNSLLKKLSPILGPILPLLKYFSPTFIWLLEK